MVPAEHWRPACGQPRLAVAAHHGVFADGPISLPEAVSLYANYSVAYQPRAGDQLSSLSLTNAALKPEKFKDLEIGAKGDLRSNLALTAALYRPDRFTPGHRAACAWQ